MKKMLLLTLVVILGTTLVAVGQNAENKKEEKVYSLLDEIHPMTFENLLENSGFSAFELQHILMKFELKNIIYQIEQNVYLRKV